MGEKRPYSTQARAPHGRPSQWRSEVEGGRARREKGRAGGGAWPDRKVKAQNVLEAPGAVEGLSFRRLVSCECQSGVAGRFGVCLGDVYCGF